MRRARYRGDLTANFHVGQVIGVTVEGAAVKCVAVEYDRQRDVTIVSGHHSPVAAPEGTRIRFHGDASGSGEVPQYRQPVVDDIEAR